MVLHTHSIPTGFFFEDFIHGMLVIGVTQVTEMTQVTLVTWGTLVTLVNQMTRVWFWCQDRDFETKQKL